MKCLIIGGNRFVGLRLSRMLDQLPGCELHVINRTGQVAHCKNAVVHKGDRRNLNSTFLDRDWDAVVDFACFNQAEATNALEFFGKVSRYIFVSTASVYDSKDGNREEDYDSSRFDLSRPALGDYQDGKRRAEAVFAQRGQFPVLSVRFPVIAGPDDYTHRLDFHIERVTKGLPIHIPNPAARISMVNSEDAANFLMWALQRDLSGPLNVASRDPISMAALLAQIELITGRKPIFAKEESAETSSPYGPAADWFMNVEKLFASGFQTRPISEWLPGLIGVANVPTSRIVH